jgi:hypothetical protein
MIAPLILQGEHGGSEVYGNNNSASLEVRFNFISACLPLHV